MRYRRLGAAGPRVSGLGLGCHLVVAHTVEVARVQQRDSRVERRMNRGYALRPIGRPVHARHVCDDPAAQSSAARSVALSWSRAACRFSSR
jgi:hypothetical protein